MSDWHHTIMMEEQMTHREVGPHTSSLLATGLHAPIRNTQADPPPTSALLLLGLTKLLVIKCLILLVVRLNEKVIGSIGEVDAIPIAEVAIDC
jgi:hypothetical protein